MREVLEGNRLSLLAVFRALDGLGLAQEVPEELHELFELDADLAEALWALDQPAERFSLAAMMQDTTRSLQTIPVALRAFFKLLGESAQSELVACARTVHRSLCRSEAYAQIPGRDPTAD